MRALKVSANTLNKQGGCRTTLSSKMQASDQVFLSSDGRSWTARITVEGCTSESEALAAVARATRAALGNAADDEADAGRRRKKRPKQDVGLYLTTPRICCASTAAARTRTHAFAEGGSGPFAATVTVNGAIARRRDARVQEGG